MKVFQIVDTICYHDASREFSSAAETEGRFPHDVLFVDTPDYVYEGWGYDASKTGDERFLQPQPPEGWEYDPATGTIYNPAARLSYAREDKQRQLSSACNAAITAGVDAETAQGTEHFALTETDQINLTTAYNTVLMGVEQYPYHADGTMCRMFTAEEIKAIAQAGTAHIMYHTTLCNHLLTWARRAETLEELEGITYSADNLPEDLAANMQAVLSAAQSL